ncbi:MAG: AraC family transcriptional regulator [Chitinophagaceae bacterium]|nr:MAG: AraC family transcriptional regulator [Chitinophagaceae bacterium]
MPALTAKSAITLHRLTPDDTGNTQFRVYQFECMTVDRAELLVPHRKDHYLVVFNRSTGGRQWVDAQPYVLQAGGLYFYGPEHVIVKEELRDLQTTGIAFTQAFLDASGHEALSKLPLLRKPAVHELLLDAADIAFVEEVLARIDAEYRRPGPWQTAMLGSLLSVLLTHASRLYTERYPGNKPTEERQQLRRFQEAVATHYRTLHEVADYAALLHLSPGYLSELVKAQSGRPAIKHIHERILMEARRLLFHTDAALKEIAFDMGFADASYFNRFFKRETGLTPAAWRAQNREMYQ